MPLGLHPSRHNNPGAKTTLAVMRQGPGDQKFDTSNGTIQHNTCSDMHQNFNNNHTTNINTCVLLEQSQMSYRTIYIIVETYSRHNTQYKRQQLCHVVQAPSNVMSVSVIKTSMSVVTQFYVYNYNICITTFTQQLYRFVL